MAKPPSRPSRPSLNMPRSRDLNLNLPKFKRNEKDTDHKFDEIMARTGKLKINGVEYLTTIHDLESLGELGSGTCGQVIKMRHFESGEIMAVKQMRRSSNEDENNRIIRDLEVVMDSYDCPYIVQCYGCIITTSDVWICMELMSTCMDKLLKATNGPIPELVISKIAEGTVKALHYLKENHSIIHRDVKPSNILLNHDAVVKLCDFGISGKLINSKAKTRSAGCTAYLAPERINPDDPSNPRYDVRADVWSLGITLVELGTGAFPYSNCKTDFEVMTQILENDPPLLNETFSSQFQNFIQLCLIKNYAERPKYHKLISHPFIYLHNENSELVNKWIASHLGGFRGNSMSQLAPTPPPRYSKMGGGGTSGVNTSIPMRDEVGENVPIRSA